MTDWLTTAEAAVLLGLAPCTVANRCARAHFRGKKVANHGTHPIWLVDKAQVEEEAALRASGWSPKQKPRRRPEGRKWAGMGRDRADPLDVAELLGQPPEPRDALKYACLSEGYHHRPIPRWQTKRQAFCAVCDAGHCYFHPELTPKELVKKAKRNG